MRLDFKGLVTKEIFENNTDKLDEIIATNDYAIIVDNGVGKYVVFNIDYAKEKLGLIDELTSERTYGKKSPFTLVEAMIKTLEDLSEKKTTAIMLSSLVEKYYGKRGSPVIIRTRAEENANNKGEVNYFTIEPGNVIGLSENSGFDIYMMNKMKKGIDVKLSTLFENDTRIALNTFILETRTLLSSPKYYNYGDRYNHDQLIQIMLSIGKYKITDDMYIVTK